VIGLARRRGTRQTAKPLDAPAPMGSVNTISSGAAMPPEDCIFRFNLIPAEYGLRVRLGSREWVTGLDGECLSLLPFTGSTSGNSRLFAATRTGIWDVTSSTAAPSQVVVFGTQDSTSGHAISCVMATAAGHFLLVTDESNGYYVYAESGATWTKVAMGGGAGEISGVDPANFAFVAVWKNRVWFVERGTGRAWYLGTNAIYGTAASFNFAARFKAGGDLRGLWSWTYDGGAGLDDSVVAISGGGDVVIYQGTDPSSASTFGIKGVWFIGGVPLGRRIASDSGGELAVMSTTGLLPLSQLVTGSNAVDGRIYATAKVANAWNKLMIGTANLRGWATAIHPLDATLIVTVPTGDGLPSRQLAMSLSTKGWSEYRDLDMGISMTPYGGTFYFGTTDGKVKIMDGYVDGVTLADPNAYADIQSSLLGAFSTLGTPNQKQIGLLEPSFISEGAAPSVSVEARYDFDLSEIGAAPEAAAQPGVALWDSAIWDEAVWAPEYAASRPTRGATGMGAYVAIALRMRSASRTILVGYRGTYVSGGFL
jgi:hypothetical protein